jgi:Cutinase
MAVFRERRVSRVRWVAGGLAALAFAGWVLAANSSSPPLDSASFAADQVGMSGASTACPTLKFFGVRGSGETATENGGYGPTIAAVKNDLGGLVDGLSATAINYPAIPVLSGALNYEVDYNESVSVGVLHLLTSFYAFKVKCPETDAVFGGYSQGADVVLQTFQELSSADQARVFVVTLGDPHFNPNQPWIDEGNFNRKSQAILVHFWGDRPHSFPRSDAGRVQSWCSGGDPICNYHAGDGLGCLQALLPFDNRCAHLQYARIGYTFEAAGWAYSAWVGPEIARLRF